MASTNIVKKNDMRPVRAKLNSLTAQPALFTITPVYVLIISVFFIATVLMLHIFSRFEQTYLHILVALVVVALSVGYGIIANR